jgi:hypothetical protein
MNGMNTALYGGTVEKEAVFTSIAIHSKLIVC